MVCGQIFIVIGQYTVNIPEIFRAQVVQKVDSAINRINHCAVDKYLENQLRYPLDRDLSAE